MTETLDEHEMTDAEYETWLAHYNWGTNIDLKLGTAPRDIPIKVLKYWERKGMQLPDAVETDDLSGNQDQ